VNDVTTHKCARCGTQYFGEQECDWCQGEKAQPIKSGTPTEEEREHEAA
jgi:primosomal protein N'